MPRLAFLPQSQRARVADLCHSRTTVQGRLLATVFSPGSPAGGCLPSAAVVWRGLPVPAQCLLVMGRGPALSETLHLPLAGTALARMDWISVSCAVHQGTLFVTHPLSGFPCCSDRSSLRKFAKAHGLRAQALLAEQVQQRGPVAWALLFLRLRLQLWTALPSSVSPVEKCMPSSGDSG